MVTGQIVIILLCTVLTIFVWLRTAHISVSPRKKRVYLSLRILLLVILMIALLEPAITVKRFPSRKHGIAVMIDASASMQIFNVDSALAIFDSCLHAHRQEKNEQQSFTYYLFGDSLRHHTSGRPFVFLDKQSRFPLLSAYRELAMAHEIVIISDAFWSNTSTIATALADKSVWYIPLTPSRHRSTLQLTGPDTVQCWVGEQSRCTFHLEGWMPKKGRVTITLFNGTQTVAGDSVTVEAGGFSYNSIIELPLVAAGLHLYKAMASFIPDTPKSIDHISTEGINPLSEFNDTVAVDTRYILCHCRAQSFRYTVIGTTPSLDTRFLKGVLLAEPMFVPSKKSKGEKPDVAFIFGSGTVSSAQLPPGTLPVYIGCMPEKTIPTSPTSFSIMAHDHYRTNPFSDLRFSDLPPIASFLQSTIPPTEASSFVSIITGKDTIPLIYHCFYQNNPAVVCAFNSFWKWDFLPLSHATSGETDIFPFSHRLISMVHDILTSQANDTFIVFPVPQPVEFAPLQLCVILPHTRDIPVNREIRCSVQSATSATLYDTVATITRYHSLFNYLKLPLFPAGDYCTSCSLSLQYRPRKESRCFEIVADKSELLVQTQNESFLREIGSAIDFNNTRQIELFLNRQPGSFAEQPIAEKFIVRRSWFLLGAIFLVLLIEWILRRTDNLS